MLVSIFLQVCFMLADFVPEDIDALLIPAWSVAESIICKRKKETETSF